MDQNPMPEIARPGTAVLRCSPAGLSGLRCFAAPRSFTVLLARGTRARADSAWWFRWRAAAPTIRPMGIKPIRRRQQPSPGAAEDQAVRQYRFLLRTAPQDALEAAHVDALSAIGP